MLHGSTPEWIEIHNTSGQTIELNGLIISTTVRDGSGHQTEYCHTITHNGPLFLNAFQYFILAGSSVINGSAPNYRYTNVVLPDDNGGKISVYNQSGELLTGIEIPFFQRPITFPVRTLSNCALIWYLTDPSFRASNLCNISPPITSVFVRDITGLSFIDPQTCQTSTTRFNRIVWDPIGDKIYGDPTFQLTAVSTTGLPVTYELISGPVQIAENLVTIIGTGDVTIRAFQAGDSSYPPAEASQTFHISKKSQLISFPEIGTIDLSNPNFTTAAISDANLPLQFFVSGPVFHSVAQNFTVLGIGAASIMAIQPGNENYLAAETVLRSFNITDNTGTNGTRSVWFADLDGDGFGDGNTSVASCFPLTGFVQNNQDCDDTRSTIKPGVLEIKDGIDNNCDGRIDEGFSTPTMLPLTLTAVCTDYPLVSRRWKITNPNTSPIRVDWEITESIERSWIDIPAGESFLTTLYVLKNQNILKIYWHDEKGIKQSIQQSSITTKCAKGSAAGRLSGESESGATADVKPMMTVFPNPTNSRITVEIDSEVEEQAEVQVISESGVIHEERAVRLDRGANFITYDLSNLSQGLYFVRTGNSTARFLKE